MTYFSNLQTFAENVKNKPGIIIFYLILMFFYLSNAVAHHNTGACPCMSPVFRLRSK